MAWKIYHILWFRSPSMPDFNGGFTQTDIKVAAKPDMNECCIPPVNVDVITPANYLSMLQSN